MRLNHNVVLKALKLAKLTCEEKKDQSSLWDARRIDEEIMFLEGIFPDSEQMLHRVGGNWLAGVREWIKQKAINGCDVTWGAHEVLRFSSPLTVYDIEMIAARAASEAGAEALGMKTKL